MSKYNYLPENDESDKKLSEEVPEWFFLQCIKPKSYTKGCFGSITLTYKDFKNIERKYRGEDIDDNLIPKMKYAVAENIVRTRIIANVEDLLDCER